MFEAFPNINIGRDSKYPLSSYLFGHRMRPNQSDIEYLIEFLQVMLAKKRLEEYTYEYFPKVSQAQDQEIEYYPEVAIALKRFIFFPNSKPEGKLQVDKDAYQACIKTLEQNVVGESGRAKQTIAILQDLFYGFNATAQNRSWFDKNMLPVCPEVILPEGMGVKTERDSLTFAQGRKEVDNKFSYNRYTYMCRGGEVYYLHLLSSANRGSEAFRKGLEARFRELICNSYPQFSELARFVKNTWASYMMVDPEDIERPVKNLNTIPAAFTCRDEYTAPEINLLLSNNIDPFDKLSILADAIMLQLLRVMYASASIALTGKTAPWVIDVSRGNAEMRKLASDSFSGNEAVIVDYIYAGYDFFEDRLKDVTSGSKTKEQKHVDDASGDSYKLFRKLAKNLGLLIPVKGPNMRLSLNERLVKVLVLTLIGPRQKITLDYFLELLYEHFGMIIERRIYETAIKDGIMSPLADYSFMDLNRDAFVTLLKDCGYLRDLSDATCIVENPFDEEVIGE